MKKHKLNKYQKWKIVAIVVAIIFAAGTLTAAFFSTNIITESRSTGECRAVENVDVKRMKSGDTARNEYRFTIESVEHAETLAFFINHHDVEVRIDGECVYTLTAAEKGIFATTGGVWVTVPLYESDVGKEVCVAITSLYENYEISMPNFLAGSEIAIHNLVFHSALPSIMLCMCVIFTGLLLIALAFYHNLRGMHFDRLYALGIMALSAGVWRVTYDNISYHLFENRTVFVYTLSIVSLMALALAMLNSIEKNEKSEKFVHFCSYAYCALYTVQFILQITGIVDLRRTLKLIHFTIIISACAFVFDGILHIVEVDGSGKRNHNFAWMIGAGVAIDLLFYYLADDSYGIIFTIVAILLYTVLEGLGITFVYFEQKSALEEMEAQLTLSRTMTMMSQIRSHFVFNVLNAISGMCKYDPKMADDTVVRFARYLRNNIDIMEKDENIPFETDLRQLEDYVALEQVRFGDKVEFYTDVEATDFKIPPLILQPIVENAIKHGVTKKQDNGTIVLRTREMSDSIIIIVEDDGVGFDISELDKEHSVGIRNIKFRLEHLVQGKFDIQSSPGVGTIVTLIIPKEKK